MLELLGITAVLVIGGFAMAMGMVKLIRKVRGNNSHLKDAKAKEMEDTYFSK